MAMKLKIKKGATVQIISGQEKGKKGTVLEINPTKLLAKVAGIRVQTHYDKKEGLLKKEGFLPYSKLKLIEGPAAKSTKAKSKSGSSKKA